LGYQNYGVKASLKVLLVDDEKTEVAEMDLPTDIEIIGDLAKVKISEKVYPYRFTVG